MKNFKQYIIQSKEADPEGVLFHGNKIIVGVKHESPIRISDSQLKTEIQQHGMNHGFYYEGKPGPDIKQSDLGLHDVSDYKGGFDEMRLQQQRKSEIIKPHNLSLIFGNVNTNWGNGISDHFKSGTVFDGIHSWARSHFGDFVTPEHVSGLLKAASENTGHDFLSVAKKTPAASGKKFLGAIEKIAWPDDWATKKRTAGPEKLVDAETRERDEHLIHHMPAGVYVIGSGHLKSIKKIIQSK
jgi:hypothetical protein